MAKPAPGIPQELFGIFDVSFPPFLISLCNRLFRLFKKLGHGTPGRIGKEGWQAAIFLFVFVDSCLYQAAQLGKIVLRFGMIDRQKRFQRRNWFWSVAHACARCFEGAII